MPIVSLDSPSFPGVFWPFKLLPSKHQRLVYGMLGHLPVHFRAQNQYPLTALQQHHFRDFLPPDMYL